MEEKHMHDWQTERIP